MRIFLTGVADVGKTSTGRKLAEHLHVRFFDLDDEIEAFFGESIERLQNRFRTIRSFREEAAKALTALLARPESLDSVIALPPSGLMGGYLRVIKKVPGIVIALSDRPENLLKRITFYDIDSKPIEMVLTPEDKRWYLKEIKKDITYFGKTYGRAHIRLDIEDLDEKGAADKLKEAIVDFLQATAR